MDFIHLVSLQSIEKRLKVSFIVYFTFFFFRAVLLGSGFIHIITLPSPQISVTLHRFQTLLKKGRNR